MFTCGNCWHAQHPREKSPPRCPSRPSPLPSHLPALSLFTRAPLSSVPTSDDQLCDPCEGRRSLFSTLALPCACSPWSRGLADLPLIKVIKELNHMVCIQGQVSSVLSSAQRHDMVHHHRCRCSVLLSSFFTPETLLFLFNATI